MLPLRFSDGFTGFTKGLRKLIDSSSGKVQPQIKKVYPLVFSLQGRSSSQIEERNLEGLVASHIQLYHVLILMVICHDLL